MLLIQAEAYYTLNQGAVKNNSKAPLLIVVRHGY